MLDTSTVLSVPESLSTQYRFKLISLGYLIISIVQMEEWKQRMLQDVTSDAFKVNMH